jgi:hypothetical protein
MLLLLVFPLDEKYGFLMISILIFIANRFSVRQY